MTRMRSASAWTAFITCSIIRIVTPVLATSRIRSIICARSAGLRPPNGSSSRSICGRMASAVASIRRFRASTGSWPARGLWSPGQPAKGGGVERVILRPVLEPERRMLSVTSECAADQDIGQDGLAVERDGGLKGARETEPADLVRAQPLDLAAFELDDAAGGGVDARDAVEKGRFAGAVGPDDGIHLAGLDGKAQVAYREQSPIGLADLLALEDRHSWV